MRRKTNLLIVTDDPDDSRYDIGSEIRSSFNHSQIFRPLESVRGVHKEEVRPTRVMIDISTNTYGKLDKQEFKVWLVANIIPILDAEHE